MTVHEHLSNSFRLAALAGALGNASLGGVKKLGTLPTCLEDQADHLTPNLSNFMKMRKARNLSVDIGASFPMSLQ